MTHRELYNRTRNALSQIETQQTASLIARDLICTFSGQTPEQMLSALEYGADPAVVSKVEDGVRRLLNDEPLAYILGEWEFYGLKLFVSPDVLIPRDDTCAVAELAINRTLFLEKDPRILDLCCGSGCIGLAVASRVKDARVTLADISKEALAVAKKNIAQNKLGGRMSIFQVDARKKAPNFLGKFDMIVSNPPYITGEEMKQPSATMSRIWRSGAATTGWIFTAPFLQTSPRRSSPADACALSSAWGRGTRCAACWKKTTIPFWNASGIITTENGLCWHSTAGKDKKKWQQRRQPMNLLRRPRTRKRRCKRRWRRLTRTLARAR